MILQYLACNKHSGIIVGLDSVFRSKYMNGKQPGYMFQCHGLLINGHLLPQSLTSEVSIYIIIYYLQQQLVNYFATVKSF